MPVYRNKHGNPHRLDGPAVTWEDGSTEWWIDGRRITDQLTILLLKNHKQSHEIVL